MMKLNLLVNGTTASVCTDGDKLTGQCPFCGKFKALVLDIFKRQWICDNCQQCGGPPSVQVLEAVEA